MKTKIIIILSIAIGLGLFYINSLSKRIANQNKIYNGLLSEVEVWKDKDSLNRAKIHIIQSNKVKDFTKIKNLTDENLELQNLVKRKNKEIKNLNSALIIKSETIIIDTVKVYTPIQGDTIIFSESILLDKIKNKYIDATFGFRYGLSYLDLQIKNDYEVVFGVEGKTLFKPGKPFAEITNLNPYTTTTTLKVYQQKPNNKAKFNLSLQTGFGGIYDMYHKNVGYGLFLGAGISYNLLP